MGVVTFVAWEWFRAPRPKAPLAEASPSPTMSAQPSPIPSPSPRDPHLLRIGVDDRPSCIALYSALEFLKGKDTRVKFVSVPDGMLRWQLLAAGRLDMACGSLDSFVSALSLDPGVLLFKIGNSAGTDAIIGRPGTKSLGELAGGSVVVTAGSPGALLLAVSLDGQGVSPSQVRVVEVDRPEDAVRLLEEGKVQGAGLWGQRADALVERGYPRLAGTGPGTAVIQDVCVVNRDTLRDRPRDVRALMEAWFGMASLLRKGSTLPHGSIAAQRGMGPGAVANLLKGEQFCDLAQNQQVDRAEQVRGMTEVQRYLQLLNRNLQVVPVRADMVLEPGFLETLQVESPSNVFGTLPSPSPGAGHGPTVAPTGSPSPVMASPRARQGASPSPTTAPGGTIEESPIPEPAPSEAPEDGGEGQ